MTSYIEFYTEFFNTRNFLEKSIKFKFKKKILQDKNSIKNIKLLLTQRPVYLIDIFLLFPNSFTIEHLDLILNFLKNFKKFYNVFDIDIREIKENINKILLLRNKKLKLINIVIEEKLKTSNNESLLIKNIVDYI